MTEYVDYPKDIVLSTKFGAIKLAVTEGRHIYVDFTSPALTVNGTSVYGSYHLGYYDAVWSCWRENGRESYHALYLQRNINTAASNSARAKVKAEVERVVNAWAIENASIFVKAECAHLNNKLSSLEEEAEELAAKLADKRAEIAKITRTLTARTL